MKRSDFFEQTPPYKEWVFWDLDNDREFAGVPTGTPFLPAPRLERRYIERVHGKLVHRGCGGDKFEYPRDAWTRNGRQIIIDCICESSNEVAVKCLRCGVVECVE